MILFNRVDTALMAAGAADATISRRTWASSAPSRKCVRIVILLAEFCPLRPKLLRPKLLRPNPPMP